VAGLTANTAYR